MNTFLLTLALSAILLAIVTLAGPLRPVPAPVLRRRLLCGLGVIVVGALFGSLVGYAGGKLEAVRPEMERINKAQQRLAAKPAEPEKLRQEIAEAQAAMRAKADSPLPPQRAAERALLFASISCGLATLGLTLMLLRERAEATRRAL